MFGDTRRRISNDVGLQNCAEYHLNVGTKGDIIKFEIEKIYREYRNTSFRGR